MSYDHDFMFMRTVQAALLSGKPKKNRRIRKLTGRYKLYKKFKNEKTIIPETTDYVVGNVYVY